MNTRLYQTPDESAQLDEFFAAPPMLQMLARLPPLSADQATPIKAVVRAYWKADEAGRHARREARLADRDQRAALDTIRQHVAGHWSLLEVAQAIYGSKRYTPDDLERLCAAARRGQRRIKIQGGGRMTPVHEDLRAIAVLCGEKGDV